MFCSFIERNSNATLKGHSHGTAHAPETSISKIYSGPERLKKVVLSFSILNYLFRVFTSIVKNHFLCFISYQSIFYLCYFIVFLPKILYNPQISTLTLIQYG